MNRRHTRDEYNSKLLKELAISVELGEPTDNIKMLFTDLARDESETERYDFVSDEYKLELVVKGYEKCLDYITKFNPERGTRPVMYFIIVLRSTFIRMIHKKHKEKKDGK